MVNFLLEKMVNEWLHVVKRVDSYVVLFHNTSIINYKICMMKCQHIYLI